LGNGRKSRHNPLKGERKMLKRGSTLLSKKLYQLTIGGGAAFWVVNFAISLTPIAAGYRAALSISYLPMLLEALLGGLMIGFCVGYFLLRFFDRIPTKNPVLKSVILSLIVLLIVTMLVEVPAKFLTPTSDALGYFLIGALFNILRILALGIVIGYLNKRLYGSA
jgi:NhaP-type Na+/H+ or K+/H+ antiporter